MDPTLNSPFLGNGDGFTSEAQELIKAINAGSALSGADAGNGFALIPQSLEQTLVRTTFDDKHVKFWKDIPKEAAFSTVEEYDRLDSYGPERISAFMPEGDLPFADDASYSRQNATVKYMGTLRAVSHPMGLVRSIAGDQIARETQNGTLWLMRQVEKALFFGSSALVPTQFDGLLPQLQAAITAGAADANSLLDRRSTTDAGLGRSLSQFFLDDLAEQAFSAPNFATIDTCYYSTAAHKNLGVDLINGEGQAKGSGIRLDVGNNQGGPIKPGWKFSEVATLFGDIAVNPDVFLNPVGLTEAQLTDAGVAQGDATARPGTPSIGVVAEQNVTTGLFGSQTGAYKYIVVAVNKSGNSVGSAAATGTVTDGVKSQRLPITKGNNGTPTGYIVYRTAKAGSTFYEIARIAYSASPQNWDDINSVIAGTSYAFFLQSSKDVVAYKQLAPFMRVPLATIDLRTRWVQLLYGTPVLKAPRKIIIVKNVL